MLPIATGLGTTAQIDQQEFMEKMRKEGEATDTAYAQEWQDVFDNAVGVADRDRRRKMGTPPPMSGGNRYASNPYEGRYASGGVVGMANGGETEAERLARLEYEASINDEVFFGNNPDAIPYNSSYVEGSTGTSYLDNFDPYQGTSDRSNDPAHGVGSGSAGITEGNDAFIFQTENDDIANVVTSTGAATSEVIKKGIDPNNITTTSGAAAAARPAKAVQDDMAKQIGNVTTGLDADNRYFITPTAGSGAERQSFLRGIHKQKPPGDYRHGFEKEFQFFDHIEDRPIERYADLFGAGANNYLAGLLSGDTGNAPTTPITYDEDGNRTGGRLILCNRRNLQRKHYYLLS